MKKDRDEQTSNSKHPREVKPPAKVRLVVPVLIVSNGKGLAWGVGDARIEKDGEPQP